MSRVGTFHKHSEINDLKNNQWGTVPGTIGVTELKPDIVIVNDKEKTVEIFELTVPFEYNIKARHTFLSNKYAHFFKRHYIKQNHTDSF